MSSVEALPAHKRLDEKKRRKVQHELKLYMEKYFKSMLGKGVDKTTVTLWEDVLIIRGEGSWSFLFGKGGTMKRLPANPLQHTIIGG
ncbi:MAG: hypothetical protein AA931_10105 [Peptococcaceae bacterium 1109]|nr:MAG: hypothetical protein AA931_10105 [Peptococcaceae bacterium 1109]